MHQKTLVGSKFCMFFLSSVSASLISSFSSFTLLSQHCQIFHLALFTWSVYINLPISYTQNTLDSSVSWVLGICSVHCSGHRCCAAHFVPLFSQKRGFWRWSCTFPLTSPFNCSAPVSPPGGCWHLDMILDFISPFCGEGTLDCCAIFSVSPHFSSFSLLWACMHTHTPFPKHLWFSSQINRAFKLQWSRRSSLFISPHILTQVAHLVNCFDLMLVPIIKFTLPKAIHEVKVLLLWAGAEQNSKRRGKKRTGVSILPQNFAFCYPCWQWSEQFEDCWASVSFGSTKWGYLVYHS